MPRAKQGKTSSTKKTKVSKAHTTKRAAAYEAKKESDLKANERQIAESLVNFLNAKRKEAESRVEASSSSESEEETASAKADPKAKRARLTQDLEAEDASFYEGASSVPASSPASSRATATRPSLFATSLHSKRTASRSSRSDAAPAAAAASASSTASRGSSSSKRGGSRAPSSSSAISTRTTATPASAAATVIPELNIDNLKIEGVSNAELLSFIDDSNKTTVTDYNRAFLKHIEGRLKSIIEKAEATEVYKKLAQESPAASLPIYALKDGVAININDSLEKLSFRLNQSPTALASSRSRPKTSPMSLAPAAAGAGALPSAGIAPYPFPAFTYTQPAGCFINPFLFFAPAGSPLPLPFAGSTTITPKPGF